MRDTRLQKRNARRCRLHLARRVPSRLLVLVQGESISMAQLAVRFSRFLVAKRPLGALPQRNFADENKDKKPFTFADPIEHATGDEKIVLILEERGITDPFYMEPIVRGPGTKDNPNVIPAFESKRLIGCVCEEDSNSVRYMWVHKSEPKRCFCGYWFKCVDAFNHFEQVQKELDELGGLAPLPPKSKN